MIVVIATIECKEESINFIENELCKLVPQTLREDGCLFYKFYQDIDQPNFFHSFELWFSKDDIKKHLYKNYMKEYFEKTKHDITKFEIKEMKQLC